MRLCDLIRGRFNIEAEVLLLYSQVCEGRLQEPGRTVLQWANSDRLQLRKTYSKDTVTRTHCPSILLRYGLV